MCAPFLTKVFTSDSLRGIDRGANARVPPLIGRSSNAKCMGVQVSGLCLAERINMVVRPCMCAIRKKRFAPNAQPAPARSCSKGAWGMLPPDKQMGHPGARPE